MKKNTTLHETNQTSQPLLPVPAFLFSTPRPMSAEEQREWDKALTPEIFMKGVAVLLKRKFDERAGKAK